MPVVEFAPTVGPVNGARPSWRFLQDCRMDLNHTFQADGRWAEIKKHVVQTFELCMGVRLGLCLFVYVYSVDDKFIL